ncbi:glycosyltransferase [Gryllotalpicola ginsengisoli]|uniref:glycosyltransferase n=1 Tax=Gryllotalpicola ginsengisoli TaxID=444608 RepID=UPI000524D428|nr:glycosyltransferase [Gryllotalpicola ginsengisoli]
MAGVIVHEWLARHGGSENVVESMLRAFPDASLVSLWNDSGERFGSRDLRESWLARTPMRKSKALALPFMPLTWSSMRFGDADFVLISSHAFAHHADWKNHSGIPRFVYVHTPARYVWTPDLDDRGSGLTARALAPLLKTVDRRAARQDARYAANSEFVRERIRSAWDRDAEVIYPPVRVGELQATGRWADRLSDAEQDQFSELPGSFVLGASRFVPYKRLDAVIEAGEAAGLPVVLAGDGPQRAELEARAREASVPVFFVIRPSDSMLFALYQEATVYMFLAVEDFGIMPVEAMALGTPVVVQRQGGAKESVFALGGGVVVEHLGASELSAGIEAALSVNMDFVPNRAADIFDEATFRSRVASWVSVGSAGRESPNVVR